MNDLAGIVDFIRARLDETEQIAAAAPPGPWSTPGPDTPAEWTVYDPHWAIAEARAYNDSTTIMPWLPRPETYINANATAAHIALHDPSRTLREVAAHRAIIAAIFTYEAKIDGEWGCCHSAEEISAGLCRDTKPEEIDAVVALASIWSDHPSWRSEWSVTE